MTQTRAGMGHNNGPTLEPGATWRRHSWSKARKQLLPVLPIEVVRLRVRRAKALGLPYRTYASIRATTGHDVIAFLFSSNALHVTRATDPLPQAIAQKLAELPVGGRGAMHRPAVPARALTDTGLIDRTAPAPRPFAPWSEARRGVLAAIRGWPADGVVMIGDTAEERDWAMAARLAWYLPSDAYFQDAAG